ncbi:MAG: hypothetical protein JO089_00460, partial [Alphaproteobacteria bacterium]|nr:hypothetical protein [Alphaproteobacteria bacterium]
MTEREPDEEESTVIIDNDLPPPTPVSRVIPGAVLLLAGIGFIALAWYAYTTGTRTLNDDELMVVEADKTPVKEKPLDPGGMKFPHQDKMIFEAISGAPAPAPAHEEHVTPSPEEPVARPQAAEQTPGAPETSSEATTTETHAVAVQPEGPEAAKTDQAAVAPAETPQAAPAATSFNPPPAVQAASPPESLPPPAKRVTPTAEEQPQRAPQ